MSTYTDIFPNLTIPKEELAKFREKVKELEDSEETWFMKYIDTHVDDSGHVYFEEYTREWCETGKFYELLANHKAKGDIISISEDGTAIMTIFDENGYHRYDIRHAVYSQHFS